MPKLKVLVIGAGLGGLCLAQTLRKAGVDVLVFERDASPWDRPQG
jgi:phytoene dehydrogenase-like protein